MDARTLTDRLTGGIEVEGGTPEVRDLLRKRSDFIAKYCAERGWDPEKLEIAQVLEIRRQEGWKKP